MKPQGSVIGVNDVGRIRMYADSQQYSGCRVLWWLSYSLWSGIRLSTKETDGDKSALHTLESEQPISIDRTSTDAQCCKSTD